MSLHRLLPFNCLWIHLFPLWLPTASGAGCFGLQILFIRATRYCLGNGLNWEAGRPLGWLQLCCVQTNGISDLVRYLHKNIFLLLQESLSSQFYNVQNTWGPWFCTKSCRLPNWFWVEHPMEHWWMVKVCSGNSHFKCCPKDGILVVHILCLGAARHSQVWNCSVLSHPEGSSMGRCCSHAVVQGQNAALWLQLNSSATFRSMISTWGYFMLRGSGVGLLQYRFGT